VIKPFPVVHLQPAEYPRRFRLWAKQFGIFRLARSLDMANRTVRRWFTCPWRIDVRKAQEIIALSEIEPLDGQPLTFEDIYGRARTAKVEVRHVQKVQAWE
jgi:hypothetical protein